MSKRIITVILCLSMLFSFCCSVNASSVQPRYNYCSNANVKLTISGGTAYCKSGVSCYANLTSSVSVDMTLQKKVLWWWDDVTSWSATYSSETASMSETHNVGNGTYRVKTEFTITANDGNTESITGYSEEVSA